MGVAWNSFYQFYNNPVTPVIFFRLNTIKGTAGAPAVGFSRQNTVKMHQKRF